jgi:hypothetical protein
MTTSLEHIYRPALDSRIRTAFQFYFQDWAGTELSVRHAAESTGASLVYVRDLVARERLDTYA